MEFGSIGSFWIFFFVFFFGGVMWSCGMGFLLRARGVLARLVFPGLVG